MLRVAVLRFGRGYDVRTPGRAPVLWTTPLRLRDAGQWRKKYLLKVLDALAPALERGTPVVVLEPSCASVFKDELCNLLPARLAGREAAGRDDAAFGVPGVACARVAPAAEELTGEILLHGHCHHRATFGMTDEVALLKRTGATVNLLDSGCCGMAGPFGFERDKYEVSQRLGERVLLPAVRARRRRGRLS